MGSFFIVFDTLRTHLDCNVICFTIEHSELTLLNKGK